MALDLELGRSLQWSIGQLGTMCSTLNAFRRETGNCSTGRMPKFTAILWMVNQWQ